MPGPVKSAIIVAKNERYALVGVAASLLVWWGFIGSKKYGLKGMKTR